MNLSRLFPHHAAKPEHLIGHIADAPHIMNGLTRKTMVFHIAEVPNVEFRLAMLPTTPARRMGDRVEMTWVLQGDGTAAVQTLYSAPDDGEIRRRNAAYLQRILENSSHESR